jgi:hypothetical protein
MNTTITELSGARPDHRDGFAALIGACSARPTP